MEARANERQRRADASGQARSRSAPCYHPAVEIVGVRITTVVEDNVARRCDGCLQVIDGTPWRLNILDIVATEVAGPWTESTGINPGPFQFHSDEACVRR